ncbi:hypothetical protein FCI23_54120 [Actinacidiphila oryziradicis]|uniref:Uncharacterized protein n=1 Tax=Actinacidiphila oryziradicis TaxID=2571141 RepID=A0A4U0RFL9_9ACTN|nr:hypothetical protein FCI23_54120 [Actinacidiphila oryziradicis]
MAFSGLMMLLDWGSGGLTPPRAGLWAVLGAMVFAVLLPPRVTAGEGWLAVRGSVRERRVCTDALVALYSCGPVAQRLVLRDAYGGCVELTPRVLAANPLLWHLLDAGARRSRERGTLRSGTDVLRELAEQIDDETARAVLRASGLE